MHKTPSAIRVKRVIRGLSQTALARMSGVSQPTISRIENGTRTPSRATAQAIARALGVDPAILFASTENVR